MSIAEGIFYLLCDPQLIEHTDGLDINCDAAAQGGKSGILLNYGHFVALQAQAQGRGQAGDARTDDKDV